MSSTESSLRGEPRSVVMSLHGEKGERGSDAFFFFGVIFFLSAWIGDASVLSKLFFLGLDGVTLLVADFGVSTGGPGPGVLGAATGAVGSDPWALSRSVARLLTPGPRVASGVGGAPPESWRTMLSSEAVLASSYS